jgi:hypothetical protein
MMDWYGWWMQWLLKDGKLDDVEDRKPKFLAKHSKSRVGPNIIRVSLASFPTTIFHLA